MSEEKKNKEAVRRLHEAVRKRDWSVLPELFAPDHVTHSTQDIKGPEGVKELMTGVIGAFPDYTETIEHMVAEGDLVAVSYLQQGTFTGEWAGTPPTGKKISIRSAVIARFENGKQVESWMYTDNLTWYQQAGIPIPQQ